MNVNKNLTYKLKEFDKEEVELAKHLFGLAPNNVYFNFNCDINIDLSEGNIINIFGLSGEGKTILKEVAKEEMNKQGIANYDFDDLNIDNPKVSEMFDMKKDREFIIRLFYTFGMFEMRNIFENFQNLSNGQKIRIRYIKLIYDAWKFSETNNKKAIIIIDEFLTFVDSLSSKVFVNSIRKFLKYNAKNIVLITLGCNDNIIKYFEDYLITMQNGKVLNIELVEQHNDLGNELTFSCQTYNKYHQLDQKKAIWETLKKLDVLQYHYFSQEYDAIRSTMIYATNSIHYKDQEYLAGFEAIQISGANKYWRSLFFGSGLFLGIRAKMKEKYGEDYNAVFGTHARVVLFPQFRGIGLGKRFMHESTEEAFRTYPNMFMMEIYSSMLYNYDFVPNDWVKFINGSMDLFESREAYVQFCIDNKIASNMAEIKQRLKDSNVKLPMETRMAQVDEFVNVASYMFKINPQFYKEILEYYNLDTTMSYETFMSRIMNHIEKNLSNPEYENNFINKVKQYKKSKQYIPIIIDVFSS